MRFLPLLRLAAIPLVVIAALVVAWKLGYFDLDTRRKLVDTVQQMRRMPGPGPEVAYVVAVAIAITLVLPMWTATLVGGALFGFWKGALLAWAGALAGTVLTHLLARHVAKAPMRRLFGEHRLLTQLRDHDDVMELLRLRILPVAPFAVLDYVAGVAGVSLRRLLLATMMGVIPSVLAYSYVGSELIRGMMSKSDTTRNSLWIAGAVTVGMLLISVTPGLIRRLRETHPKAS